MPIRTRCSRCSTRASSDGSTGRPARATRCSRRSASSQRRSSRREARTDAARRRHAEYFLDLARSANLSTRTKGNRGTTSSFLRGTTCEKRSTWALGSGEQELGLELVVALEGFWSTNSPQEGAEWAARLLAGEHRAPDHVIARGLRVQGGMEMLFVGSRGRRAPAGSRRWTICRRGRRRKGGVPSSCCRLANVALLRGDLERAQALAEESLVIQRRIGFRKGEVYPFMTLCGHRARGERSRARCSSFWRRAGASPRRSTSAGGSSACSRGSPLCPWTLARIDDARRSARRALELSRAMYDHKAVVYELGLLAEVERGSRRLGAGWHALGRRGGRERTHVDGPVAPRDRSSRSASSPMPTRSSSWEGLPGTSCRWRPRSRSFSRTVSRLPEESGCWEPLRDLTST